MKTTTKRFLSILLSVFMLFGTVALAIPAMVVTASADDYTDVTPNTDFEYNGRTYRLDVYSGNSESYAHINANGTIDLKIRHGDMLWFPDVQMTDSTAIHAEVTALISMENKFSGFAYAVRPDGNGVWANTMVAVMKSASRVRITPASYSGLGTISGSDRGNGGNSPRAYDDGGTNAAYYATDAYKGIETNTTNHDWGSGKTLSFDVSNSSGTVSVTWGNPNVGSFATKSYTTASNASYSYTGSVGYTPVWTGNDDYFQVRIERITVTNCTVGGNATAVWNAVGREMPAHTDTVVNGVTYRFDPLDGHTVASCWIMDDNTFRVRLQAGDLFWLPGSNAAAGADLTAKMINNNGQKNGGNLAAGLAYHIDLGANGTWGDSEDSLNNAHLQTTWRRRVCSTTAGGANTSCTKLGVQSTNTLEEANRNANYLAFGNRWGIGKVLKINASINESGYVYFSFRDESGVEMNYDYYEPAFSGDKVLDGPIGFYAFWDGDNSERYSMTVDILELTPITDGISHEAISTSLNGTIGLNFKFHAATYVATNASLVVTKAGNEILNESLTDLWDSGTRAFVCTIPVFAKEMTDSINFSIKIGGEVYNGKSYTVTVKQYAQALAASDPAWADLMNAMLDYGAAAQELFGYNTENLAADISGGITYDVAGLPDLTTDGDRSFLSAIAGTLTLESGTDLNLYFKPVDPGATLTATAEDQSHNAVALETETVDGYLKVSIKDLAAEELGDEFYITVTDGAKSVTLNYSALCWVKSAVGSASASDETKTLAKAVGVYASEAQKKNQ